MMNQTFLQIVSIQAVQISVVTLLVALLACLFGKRHPQLIVALWAVVLLKCLTPPLMSSPLGIFSGEKLPSFLSYRNSEIQPLENQNGDRATSVASADEITTGPNRVSETQVRSPDVAVAEIDDSRSKYLGGSKSKDLEAVPWEGRSVHPRHGTILIRSLPFQVWIAGAISFLACAIVRTVRCVRRISLSQVEMRVQLDELAELIHAKFGQRPRILASSSPSGPAVFGLFRPTIAMPVELLKRHSSKELVPIVAHELSHIRRGDIWFATIQIAVQSLWWFHPLVWLANHLANKTIERRCDRDVVTRFGVPPAEYAHSLLHVLELNSQSPCAPAVLGVHAFHLTSQRLETIMNLRQGCHGTTRLWTWMLIFGFACVTIPGATWAAAKAWQAETPRADGGDGRVIREYEVSRLLQRLKTERPDIENPQSELIRQLAVRADLEPTRAGNWTSDRTVNSLENERLTWLEDSKFGLLETPAAHQRVEKALQDTETFGFRTETLDFAIVHVSDEVLAKLPIEWRSQQPSSENSSLLNHALLSPDQVMDVGMAFASGSETAITQMPALVLPQKASGVRLDGNLVAPPQSLESSSEIPTIFEGMAIRAQCDSVNGDMASFAFTFQQSWVGQNMFTFEAGAAHERVVLPVAKIEDSSIRSVLGPNQILVVSGIADTNHKAAPNVLIFIQRGEVNEEKDVIGSRLLRVIGQVRREKGGDDPPMSVVYYVGDLVCCPLGKPDPEGAPKIADELIGLAKQVCGPDSWNETGRIVFHKESFSLIVTQSREVHEQIEDLILKLREITSTYCEPDLEFRAFAVEPSMATELVARASLAGKPRPLSNYETHEWLRKIEANDKANRIGDVYTKHVPFTSKSRTSFEWIELPLREKFGHPAAPESLKTNIVVYPHGVLMFDTKWRNVFVAEGQSILFDLTDTPDGHSVPDSGDGSRMDCILVLMTVRLQPASRTATILGHTFKR